MFSDEIVPVEVKDRKGKVDVVDNDEYPRPDVTEESISGLAPAFKEDGTVTAANASGINDAAAALLLMSEKKAKTLGISPIGTLVSGASTGVDPAIMGIGPVSAVQKALSEANLTLDQVNLVELNEAFAAQSLAVCRSWASIQILLM